MPGRVGNATDMNDAQRRKALSFARPERPLGCADLEATSGRAFAIVVEAAFETC
jgi:hypothetical protein